MQVAPETKPIRITHDGPVTIASGKSRKDVAWKNQDLSWSQFLQRVSTTSRTAETVDEYKKSPKSVQDEIKDVGGFVGGGLKGGRRKTDAVAFRSLLTLDADFAPAGKDLLGTVEMLIECACAVYSTHKHTPSSPRLRFIIPLTRPVSPDEYQAVARKIADTLGMDYFDDTTYEPQRLMYWPSTSIDGEYIFRHVDDAWLDPDKVLAEYEHGWQDQSFWPESSRATTRQKKLTDRQGDPTAKRGIVGAFCRAYTISAAINAFLADVYTPSGALRYTYVNGSTTSGLVVYDDDCFAYSHHGTDPAGASLCNSFDLVRAHLFKELDDETLPGTPVTKLPSYQRMVEFAGKDDAVKSQLIAERMHAAGEEFEAVPDDAEWQKTLETDKKGNVLPSLTNFARIMAGDARMQHIMYNAHRSAIWLADKVPWRKAADWHGPIWTDEDSASLRVYMEKVYRINNKGKCEDALSAVSRKRSFHPIKEYLNALPEWDGMERLETLLIDYLGAEDTPYVRQAMRKSLLAAVTRIYKPGTKFDEMLVLAGPQGIGKSTLFAKLGGDWTHDSMNVQDMHSKEGAQLIQGSWIIEISELAGLKKADIEVVKGFLSRQVDKYRPSYGHYTVENPRQCIFVGSTNSQDGFLRDITGNRRFWPVNVKGGVKKVWEMDQDTVDQIWAETLEAYKANETLLLSDEAVELAREAQLRTLESDDRAGMVEEYLDRLLPLNWEDLGIQERRMWLMTEGNEDNGVVRRDRVCACEIWCECFGKAQADIKIFDAYAIRQIIMKVKGWKEYQHGSGKLRVKMYGPQRVFVRMK